PDDRRHLRYGAALRGACAQPRRDAVRNLVLLPEALVVAMAVLVMLSGRFGWIPRASSAYLPQATALVVLIALGVELWAGATLTTLFGGALVQDRFALFAKAAALLTAAVALAATDWTAEDSLHLGLAMPLLAAFGIMVAASAADLVGLWAGLELAAAAGVVLVSLRRPDLGLRRAVVGGVAVAAALVAVKLAAALIPIPAVYVPYANVIAALAMLGGGAAALAVRSPRPRLAYLAVGQLGWVAAGLVTHFRSGTAAALFLLGAFAVAATCGPALLGRAEGGEPAIAGLGAVRPVRSAGFALAILSLAGAPPMAGFFGELSVAAALAQSGNFVLLGLGLLGSVLSIAAAVGTLRVLYIQSPLEEARRGAAAALPAVTGLSSLG